jgi:TRAP-type C4-dicarboxylate transport system permease small subunit
MKAASRWIKVFEDVSITVAVLLSVAISVVGVFFRYVIGSSLGWVEEMAGFILLIVVTIGIGVAVRRGSHLRVDMVIQFIPKTKESLNLVSDVVALGVMSILLVLSVEFVSDLLLSDRRTTSMYWLPIGVPLIIMPIGYLTAVFRLVENLLTLLKKVTKQTGKSV